MTCLLARAHVFLSNENSTREVLHSGEYDRSADRPPWDIWWISLTAGLARVGHLKSPSQCPGGDCMRQMQHHPAPGVSTSTQASEHEICGEQSSMPPTPRWKTRPEKTNSQQRQQQRFLPSCIPKGKGVRITTTILARSLSGGDSILGG